MKAYLITTGTVFGLITVAHVWRAFAEGSRVATEPFLLSGCIFSSWLKVWKESPPSPRPSPPGRGSNGCRLGVVRCKTAKVAEWME